MSSFATTPGTRLPSVLVTGTPGTGKTATCSRIAELVPGMKHIEVSAMVKAEGWHESWDDEFQTYVLDEDAMLDGLEDQVSAGGCVVDFHSSDLFPERWFDLVLVLRCNNTALFDRLTARGYAPNKVTENLECEIMQTVLEEAREAYPAEIVHECPSESLEHLEANVQRVVAWIPAWQANNDK